VRVRMSEQVLYYVLIAHVVFSSSVLLGRTRT